LPITVLQHQWIVYLWGMRALWKSSWISCKEKD